MSTEWRGWRWGLLGVAAAVWLAAGWLVVGPAFAGGQVGTGTPGSCTEVALDLALAGGGTVTFNCGAAPHTISLSFYKPIAVDTHLQGGGRIILSGASFVPHFQVALSRTLTLDGITLSQGNNATYGSIQNFGTLVITNSTLAYNNGSGDGGAIDNYGVLRLTGTTLISNTAAGSGGAIYNNSGGEVTLNSSQVISNTANAPLGGGGGVNNAGQLVLSDVTFESNRAFYAGSHYGGGLFNAAGGTVGGENVRFLDNGVSLDGHGAGMHNAGVMTLSRAQFIGNHAYSVGGAVNNTGVLTVSSSVIYRNVVTGTAIIYSAGTGGLSLINVTLSGNRTGSSASVLQVGIASQATLWHTSVISNSGSPALGHAHAGVIRLKNTIVADNTPANCSAADTVTSDGFNISGDATCALNQTGDHDNTNPLLGALADNGGGTLTHMPLSGSLAIDTGQCIPGVTVDQRGVTRPYGAACDIGAVELTPRLLYMPVVVR